MSAQRFRMVRGFPQQVHVVVHLPPGVPRRLAVAERFEHLMRAIDEDGRGRVEAHLPQRAMLKRTPPRRG